jgi:hypothetical protein
MMAAHTDDRATVTMAQSNLLPLNQEPKSLESVQSGGDRYAVEDVGFNVQFLNHYSLQMLCRWKWKAVNGNALVNASAGRNLPFIQTNPIDLSFTKLLMWW